MLLSFQNKEKALFQIAWISIIVNFSLFLIKVFFGWKYNSQALIADGAHSAADSITSAIVIYSVFIIQKVPSKQHPFGQQRMEEVASLIISVLLAVTSIELLLPAIHNLFLPKQEVIHMHWILWFVAALSIILKEILFYITRFIGNRFNSSLMHADAWHHRLDSITSFLLFIVFIGIYYQIYWLDAVITIMISLFIFKEAISLMYSNIKTLLGTRVNSAILSLVKQEALLVKDVINTHDLVVHQYGSVFHVGIHIEVNSSLSVEEMHDIAHNVEERILAALPPYSGCIVHVDPIGYSTERYNEVKQILDEFIKTKPILVDYHDLQLRDIAGIEVIQFEFTTTVSDITCYARMQQEFTVVLKPQCKDSILSFSLEPDHHLIC